MLLKLPLLWLLGAEKNGIVLFFVSGLVSPGEGFQLVAIAEVAIWLLSLEVI